MKKFVSLLLVLCIVGLTGCTTAADEPEKSAAASSEHEIKTYPMRMEDFVDGFRPIDAPIISDDVSDLEEGKIYTFIGEVENVELPDESNKNLGSITLNIQTDKITIFVLVSLVMDTTGCSFRQAYRYFPMPEKGEICCIYASYAGCVSDTNEMIGSYGGLAYDMGVATWIQKMYTNKNDKAEDPISESNQSDTATIPEPEPTPTEYTFTAGNYYVGEDIPAGRYDVTWVSGRGNCFAGGMVETFGENSKYQIKEYKNAELKDGGKVEVSDTLTVKFTSK